MEIFIFLSWFFITLLIFGVLGVAATNRYLKGDKSSKILFKLIIAFIGYIVATSVTLIFFGALANEIIHARPNRIIFDSNKQLFFGTLLTCYTICGWLLCSYINGSFVNPIEYFFEKEEKVSLFDNKKNF